jgi:hypothetical protein
MMKNRTGEGVGVPDANLKQLIAMKTDESKAGRNPKDSLTIVMRMGSKYPHCKY